MKYPSEFPQDARARVETEALRAYAVLEQEVRGIESWRRDVPFIRCIMRVFIAFAREACAFGKKSNLPVWSDSELDQRCRDFLLSIVVDLWEDKAKDLGIRKMFSSPHNWGYSLDDGARRKIENSPEWKEYQDLLLDAFESQSARAADCSLPQHEQAGGTAPKTDGAGASSGERRRAVVEPILKTKDWTVNKWGAQAGVGKNCAYEYLDGRRNLSKANRLALAQVLGLTAEDLPN